MGKILDKVVQDDAAPSRSDLWLDGEILKANIHGKWKSISGGGSGAGVTIVDSVDKLDEKAPVGSMAVVVKKGNTTKAKFSELYQLDMNNDMEVDRVNMTVTIKNQEKFDLISDVDFILPKDNKLISGKTSNMLIGPFEIFNDIMMGSGDPSSVSVAIMINAISKNDIITSVKGAVIYKGEIFDFVLIQSDGEKYVLNEEGIKGFKNYISNIDIPTYYICEINSLMGSTELPIYLDNFITFYKGTRSDSKIFIKDDKWRESFSSELKELDNKINSIKNLIPTKNSQLQNDSNYLINQYINTNVVHGTDITITNNTSIELDTIDQSINVVIDETDNLFYKAYIIYYQNYSGKIFNIGDKEFVYNDGPGKYLLEINKINEDIIICKNTYLGKIDFGYIKIEITSTSRPTFYLGFIDGTYIKAYRNGNYEYIGDLELGGVLEKDTIYEIYFKGTYTVRLSNKTTNNSGSEYYVEANIMFLDFENNNNKIKFIKYKNPNNKETSIKLTTDCSYLHDSCGLRVSEINYIEGVKYVEIPCYEGYEDCTPNIILPNSIEKLKAPFLSRTASPDPYYSIGLKNINKLWDILRPHEKSTQGHFTQRVRIYEINNNSVDLVIPNKITSFGDVENDLYIDGLRSIHFHQGINYIKRIGTVIHNSDDIKEIWVPNPYFWNPIIEDSIGTLSNIKTYYHEHPSQGGLGYDYLQIQNTLCATTSDVNSVTLKYEIEKIGNYACEFSNIDVRDLSYIKLIGTNAFYGAKNIKYLKFSKLERVLTKAFGYCSAKYYDFSNNKEIPIISNDTFYQSSGIIIVPQSLYEEWIITKNWDTLTDKIVPVVKSIQFNVEENYCIVESGYTWEQYINSKFCNFAFTIVDGVVMIDNTNNVQLNEVNVLATDVIQSVEYSILINEVQE